MSEYRIEISAPDISSYKTGNTGIDYVTTFDSGKNGPHVMISAVVHGNELCGAITLAWLLQKDITVRRGKLTLAFMNTAAFLQFNPENPTVSRFVDEDFNRLWSPDVLGSGRTSAELSRARELRPLIDQVDYLLDIHSMQSDTVPLMMCGPTAKGQALARAIAYPGHIVSDSGHRAGKRMRDYQDFINPASAKNALLVECGQHWQASSVTVAKETTLRFLKHFDMFEPDFIDTHLHAEQAPRPKVIEVSGPVTIQNEHFRFADNFQGMEVIDKQGTLLGWDGDEEVYTPYDNCVLIMPSKRLQKGHTAVRLGRFID